MSVVKRLAGPAGALGGWVGSNLVSSLISDWRSCSRVEVCSDWVSLVSFFVSDACSSLLPSFESKLRPCSIDWRPFPMPAATPPIESVVSLRPSVKAFMVVGGCFDDDGRTRSLADHVTEMTEKVRS